MSIKITNKNNIPELFMRACLIDDHITNGDISVTTAIGPVQKRYLLGQHDIEQEAEEMLWMLFGTAMHNIVERAEVKTYAARKLLAAANVLLKMPELEDAKKVSDWLNKFARVKYPEAFDENVLIEKTLSVPVKVEEGTMVLSGTLDKYEQALKKLSDYKNTSVYAYINEESRKKWGAQLNVYAWMLRAEGYEVEKASVIAIFRDWSAANKKRIKNYPKSMVMEIDIPLLSNAEIEKYIKSRIKKNLIMELQGIIPRCTAKERWYTGDTYAVYKEGTAKDGKALKVESSIPIAEAWIKTKELTYTGKLEIRHRPGENKHCESFCPVRSVCPQRKEFNEKYNK